MSAKFEIVATNDVTAVTVAIKYTLPGAFNLAYEIWESWDDIVIREREEGSDVFKIVAKLSRKGLFI